MIKVLSMKVKMFVASTILIGGSFLSHVLHAEERLLIATHRAAGLNCAQCHLERPPSRAPAASVCITCHGDQQMLARKTENANPNPHVTTFIAPRKCRATHAIVTFSST
jgi:hypothetical protein